MVFASVSEEDEFEFLVKNSTESPKGSATLFGPQTDRQVVLKKIVGHGFPVENHEGHDLVFVAMGTGLAPLRSTLRHLLRSRQNYGRLVVLYGARTVDDFCFEREMATEWPELNDPVALVCGSSEMIEQTRARLLSLGFAAEKILTNY